MVSILLIALLVVLAIGAAAGTSALVVGTPDNRPTGKAATRPGGHREPHRPPRGSAAAGRPRAPHRGEPRPHRG